MKNGKNGQYPMLATTVGKYDPEYVRISREVCKQGARSVDLARILGVNKDTINEWRLRYPEFEEATRIGKETANAAVERSLYENATGFYADVEKVFLVDDIREEYHKDGTLKSVSKTKKVIKETCREFIKADTTACIFFLKNRDRKNWSDRTAIDHTGFNGDSINKENAREVFHSRVASIAARFREVTVISETKDNS